MPTFTRAQIQNLLLLLGGYTAARARRLAGTESEPSTAAGATSLASAEARLMTEEHVPTDDFFTPRDQLLTRAYDQRGAIIAYQESATPIPPT